LIDPEDPTALAATMCRIVADVSLRGAMAERGLARAAQFSWRQSAEELQALFCELTAGRVRHG
jgi:glycosyltransferase involved in cell wall biosynthesis